MDAGVQPLLFMKTETLAHRMGPSTLSVSFLASINPIYSSLRTYQEACCIATLDLVKLTGLTSHSLGFFFSESQLLEDGDPCKAEHLCVGQLCPGCMCVKHLFSLAPAFLGGEMSV